MRDTAVSDIFLNLPAGCNNETEDPVPSGPSGDTHRAERAVGGVHQEQQWADDEQLVIPQQ